MLAGHLEHWSRRATVMCPQLFSSVNYKDADRAIVCINGTKLDDRVIRTDWDAGFVEGRQYGRGKSGGQVSVHL